jgi:hypothetical protein
MQSNSGLASAASSSSAVASASPGDKDRDGDGQPAAISETAVYAFVAWLTSIFGYCEYIKAYRCGTFLIRSRFYFALYTVCVLRVG